MHANNKTVNSVLGKKIKIKKENKQVYLAGDFNYNLLHHEKNVTISKFLNMILQNNLQPCITEPSRIVNGNKPSLIDNIFTNTLENTISGNLFEKISDHMPNFVIIQNVKANKKKQTIQRRDMRSFDPVTYQAQLRHSILLEIDEIDDIEDFNVAKYYIKAKKMLLQIK